MQKRFNVTESNKSLRKYMNKEQIKNNKFYLIQFSCCPLVRQFCSCKASNKIALPENNPW